MKSRRDDVELRRATRFTPALRLCISGCVCSTKRSLLSVFVAPECDLRPHGRSARNAPAHPSGRSSALLLRPFRPRIGCFSSSFFHFLLLYPFELACLDLRSPRISTKQLIRIRVKSSFREIMFVSTDPEVTYKFARCLYKFVTFPEEKLFL